MRAKTASWTLKGALALCGLALLLARPAAAAGPCSVALVDVDGDGVTDLDIKGNTGHQRLWLDLYDAKTHVALDCDGVGGPTNPGAGDINQDFSPPGRTLYVRLQGTDDITVNIAEDLVGEARNLALKMGAGTNNIVFGENALKSPGRLLGNSALVVHVDGMVGREVVTLNLPPEVDASSILFRAELGDANDVIDVHANGAVKNGSMVDLKLDGGGYANRINLDWNGTVAGSTLAVDAQGGPGLLDAVDNTIGGQVLAGGRLLYTAWLNAGNDKFNQLMNLGTFSVAAGGEARFRIMGEAGGDTINVIRGTSVGGPTTLIDGLFDLTIDGGQAGDKILVDLGGGGFVTNGTYRLRIDGGASNDTITATIDVAAGSNPQLDWLFHGDNGTDKLTLALNNAGANAPANYGPLRSALVDGGYYPNDTCLVTGNALVHERNCEF